MLRFSLLCLLMMASLHGAGPLIIAHRGASAYLPEHTLEAKAMAHALGADYIEQDVVLSRDGVPIVLHDIHLDTVTDVASRFPARAREDGRFYAIDFDLAEIRSLRVSERFDPATGAAVYPNRFPVGQGLFRVPTLAEEIELIQGLNRSTGRTVGLYPEIKSPAWHRQEGYDISRLVLATLADYGYSQRSDPVFVQCFDAAETRRLREELGTDLRLVQLIGANSWQESATDYDQLVTREGLARVARYADGVGPWIPLIIHGFEANGQPQLTAFMEHARAAGLLVHPFTLRADALPAGARSYEHLYAALVEHAGVDGLFTDFPDRRGRQ
ncbi:MAG: glycerophosphodiester phosphodiesterase [Opitutales bacterium]